MFKGASKGAARYKRHSIPGMSKSARKKAIKKRLLAKGKQWSRQKPIKYGVMEADAAAWLKRHAQPSPKKARG